MASVIPQITPSVEHIFFSTNLALRNTEDVPSGRIVIAGLPAFKRLIPTGELNDDGTPKMKRSDFEHSRLMRIIHQYKNLVTEGDCGGKREYNRKRRNQLPLQNPSLRLPLSYSYSCRDDVDSGTIRLTIDFFCNTAGSAFIVEDESMRTLTKSEISNYIHDYSWACAKDLEIYFQDCLDNTPADAVPDYYGFPDQT